MAMTAKAKNKGSTAMTLVVPGIKKTAKNAELLSMIDKAIQGAKSVVQSIQQVEPLISKAANACLAHAHKTGDTMPADRLVKGLIALNHPSTTAMGRELTVWFRQMSPIRWDAKGKVRQAKEGEEGYKPYDEAQATETSFTETPQAKRARAAADRAHKQNMKEADFPMMLNRTKGILGWFNNMAEGKDERKIKAEDQAKMIRFGKALNATLKEFGGEEAVVELAKAKKVA